MFGKFYFVLFFCLSYFDTETEDQMFQWLALLQSAWY